MPGMKIRKGDRVQVLQGKDRGKTGEVTFAFPAVGKVIVDGVNVAKKHQKPTRSMEQGGIIDKEMPVDVSNVAIVCDSCDRPSRVGYRFDADGTKIRVCRRCGGDI
jgi:large subunit ribosomal protein L24